MCFTYNSAETLIQYSNIIWHIIYDFMEAVIYTKLCSMCSHLSSLCYRAFWGLGILFEEEQSPQSPRLDFIFLFIFCGIITTK